MPGGLSDPMESVVDYDRDEMRTMRALDEPMELDTDEPTKAELEREEAER